MVAKTDKRLAEDITGLIKAGRRQPKEQVNRSRDAIPASSGESLELTGRGNAATGIQSPLTETSFTERTFFDTESIVSVSSDGLFVLEARAVKEIKFEDAEGNPVSLIFQKPI